MPLSYLGRMKLGDNSSFLKRQEKSSVQTQIRNAQNRLQSAGVDYSNDGSSQNFLLRALDILSRPGYGATNVIREFTNPYAGSTPQEFDPLAAFLRGLKGQDKAQGKDIFTDLGWEGEKGIFGGEAKWYNPSAAGVAGLALDIFNPLDPVNWLAFGIGDDIIKGGARGVDALTDAFGATKATQIADILKKGSKSIDDLGAESVGKLAKQVINMIDDPDDLKSVVQMIREGIVETGRNATSKLDYKAMKPIQIGLQNPLSIGNSGMAIKLPGYKASGGKMKLPILYPGKDIDITMRNIPGSEYVTDIISKIAQKVGSVRVGTGATLGESLGKMFSTVFVPNTVPNAVIKKNLTANNMSDLITISRTTPENVPLSIEELMKLNDDLAEVKLDNVFDFADNMSATDLKKINKGNYLSIENLAKKVGLKGFNASEITDILSDTPFNKTITEIYDQLRVLKPTDDAKDLFTKAAKLRKVMDLMYEQIPEGLKPYFSGVLKAQMTNLYPTDLATNRLGKNIVSSPLMAYEFNYKGVPISVVVNSGEDFNLNAWARVSATLEALDELPETAIQALQGQIDISPIPIKNPDTSMTIGDTIVLGRIDKPTVAHEYGHIWDSVAGDQDSYIKAILSDAQKIDDTLTPDDLYSDYSRSLYDTDNNIGIKEDLADSVSDYIADPKTFRELYPNRAAEIEKMIGKASISREELAQLVTKQRKLSESVAQIPRTEAQITKMVEDIDKFAFEMTWQPGEKTYQSFRGKLNALFEQTNWKTKQWQEQVATIFKGLDEEARKQIMDAAAQITGTEIPGVKKTAEYATNPGEYRFKVDLKTGDFQFELQDIDTPEFKEWFKGSKVVDKDGSPLVVYHGTTEKSPFTVFNTNPPTDVGAHFGTKEAANSILAGKAIKNIDNMSANIYPVYLSIKNPLEVQDAFGGDVAGTALEIHDALQARGANLYDLTERLKKQTEILDNWPGMETEYMGMTWDEFVASNRELDKYAVEIAKKNGFDGLVYDNIFEGDVFGDNLSWVAFEPNQIKSATGNIGTFSKNSDNILYAEQEFPIFMSKLEEVVNKMPNRMPVEDFKNYLKGKQVKKEELKWTFIDDLLEGKTHVTKAEVQEWVVGNKLEVQEVWRKTSPGDLKYVDPDELVDEWVDSELDDFMDAYREDLDPELLQRIYDYSVNDPNPTADNLQTIIEDYYSTYELMSGNQLENIPKYRQYTQPGGEDYTELIFTLPEGYDTPSFSDLDLSPEQMDEMFNEVFRRYDLLKGGQGTEQEIIDYIAEFTSLPPNRAKVLYDMINDGTRRPYTPIAFQSSHWSEPNVVAHTRFDTRYTEDGRKILFIDEIQSDWHQAGRDKGYIDLGYTPPTAQEMAFAKEEVRDIIIKYKSFGFPHSEIAIRSLETMGLDNFMEYLAQSGFKLSPEEIKSLKEYQGLLKKSKAQLFGVPDAPFRNTWDEYVQKRLLRYAADNGYDGIAWSTGKQQADRWGQAITENIDTIQYNQNTQQLKAYKNNEEVLSRRIPKEELSEIVGVDIARKLLDTTPDGETVKTVSGTNITIGGEGMRKFYDQQIPSNFKKIGKKFGLKIDEIELDFSGDVNKFYPTEEFEDAIRFYFPDDIEDGMDGYLMRAETFVRYNLEEEYNSVQEFLDGIDPELRFPSTEDVDKLIEFSVNFADEHGESINNLEQIRERFYNQVEMPQREITWQDGVMGEFDLEQWNYKQEFEARPKSKQQGIWLDPKSRQAIRQQSFPLYAKQDAQGPVDNLTAGWSDRQITALDNFLKWRNSVVKQYRQLGIPINELEKYVPFIPKRTLRGEEADIVKTVFGTGVEQATGDNFDTLLAELSKMDPNLKRRTTKATRPSEVNKLLKSDWLTEDAAVAMSLRGTRAIKAQEFRKFGDEFIAEYGLHATDITKMTGGSVPEGYVAYKVGLDQEGNKIFQQARDVVGATMDDTEIIFLPEEMVNLYNEYLGIMFNKQKKNGLVQIYDSMSRLYKKAAYLWNPGHVFRDFQGNVFNNYLMGVTDPMEYAEGLRVLRGAEGFLDTPNGQIPYKDIYEKAQQMGIIDSIMEHELPTLTGKTESGYSKAMRKATYATDGWTRITGFIHNLKQGQSFEQAAATTKKFLFDYFDLTSFERKVMKRIIPFYTWTRKNIPLQLEVLVKNPRVFARINDVQNAIAGENIDWTKKPEYIQDMVGIQPKGSDMYVAMNLPYQDLTRLPINSNTSADLLSSINPIIRAPIESITNQRWWTGQKLEKYPGEKTDIPVLTTLLEMLGQEQGPQIGARYGGNVLNNIPILTRAGNLLDAVSGKETNDVRNLSRVSTTIGGPAFFDAASVENSADWQERQRLIDLIQLLQDEGYNIPTSGEARKEGRYRKLSRLLSR